MEQWLSIYALKSRGLLTEKDELTIETRAGILPIRIESLWDGTFQITMQQASPQFEEFKGSSEELAQSIGLEKSDIDGDLPIVYGSTGIWTLLVPIKKLSAFNRMKPNTEIFPSILKEIPRASIHPFCLETYDAMLICMLVIFHHLIQVQLKMQLQERLQALWVLIMRLILTIILKNS